MPALSHPTFGPKAALAYITGGTLMCVWTLVWYFTRDHALAQTQWFWVAGLFFSGVTLGFLGLLLGPLGTPRPTEMPSADVLRLEAAIQQVAAHPPAVVVAAPPVLPTAPETPVPSDHGARMQPSPAH